MFVVPHPPGPVLSRIGDSEPAPGRPCGGLLIHNHPLSVMHREDAVNFEVELEPEEKNTVRTES